MKKKHKRPKFSPELCEVCNQHKHGGVFAGGAYVCSRCIKYRPRDMIQRSKEQTIELIRAEIAAHALEQRWITTMDGRQIEYSGQGSK